MRVDVIRAAYKDKVITEKERNLLMDFFDFCGEKLIHSKYGIKLKRIGYFCGKLICTRYTRYHKDKIEVNEIPEVYRISFWSIKRASKNPFLFVNFYMERHKKRKIKNLIQKGLRYTPIPELNV